MRSSLTTLRHNFLRLQIIVIKIIIIIIVVVIIVKVCVIIKVVHFLLTAFGAPTVRLICKQIRTFLLHCNCNPNTFSYSLPSLRVRVFFLVVLVEILFGFVLLMAHLLVLQVAFVLV